MNLIWAIPLLPALGALLNGVFGVRFFSKRVAGIVACTSMAAALAVSLVAFFELLGLPAHERAHEVTIATWFSPMPLMMANGTLGTVQVPWSVRLDPLSGLMILVVTGIGFLIHVYSVGYMHDEPRNGYARYFCYLNLFCFFMLTLVLASNFLVMFVGWEGVGLCSYLLIGYWYEKKNAADAGKKAFLVNRVGDWGFLLGIFLIFSTFGTFDFRAVADAAGPMAVEHAAFGVLSLICLLLFIGATGKSAQIPLHVWLPDAMEGPTPVSALIHAATMVTAGVYMLGRNAVLFSHAPMVLEIVAIVGVLTALMAATIGLVQNDIKRVLAYSTVSQLGFMFLAMGVGAYAAGVFHLMTHAFFKALLFLCSGAVIHAMAGEQDMRRMGGLRRYLPVTFVTMMIGTLAIAGIPPLSGFFSKDEILFQAFQHNVLIWLVAAITAFMTAFYMFRLISMTFFGDYRGPNWEPAVVGAVHEAGAQSPTRLRVGAKDQSVAHPADAVAKDQSQAHKDDHPVTHGPADSASDAAHGHGAWHGPHEAPRSMTVPLMILAVGAIVAGLVGIPKVFAVGNAIEAFLEPSFTVSEPSARAAEAPAAPAAEAAAGAAAAEGEHHVSALAELGLMGLSILIAVLGIWIAYRFYVLRPEISEHLAAHWARAHRVLSNKYYVDELYSATFVSGTLKSATGLWGFDRRVVDGAVNGSRWVTVFSSWISHLIDKYIVDGLVNLVGYIIEESSFVFRRWQTGLVQNYALLMLFGVFAFVSIYLFWK